MRSKSEFKYEDDYKEYLRHYFAGLAMQSYFGGEYVGQSGMPVATIAPYCVQMADALIIELNKKDETL